MSGKQAQKAKFGATG